MASSWGTVYGYTKIKKLTTECCVLAARYVVLQCITIAPCLQLFDQQQIILEGAPRFSHREANNNNLCPFSS